MKTGRYKESEIVRSRFRLVHDGGLSDVIKRSLLVRPIFASPDRPLGLRMRVINPPNP